MLHAVVMAGGSGTRFWPKSRRSRPKQLLRLFGDSTMLQQTVERIAPMAAPDRTWIITGQDQAEAVRAQLPQLPPEQVIAEPCPRDTAPCVGLAALAVSRHDPDAVMVVMPADHVIEPASAFRRTIDAAVSAIQDDPSTFITFGIKPSYPEIGYGYIEQAEFLGERGGVVSHRVAQFREKPNRELAEEFLATGRFVWNAGIFLWRADAILHAIAEFQPKLAAGLKRIAPALGTPQEAEVLAREFPQLPKAPIDKAVMEKAPNVRVLEATYTWSDVGDWRALAAFLKRDDQGNAVDGPVRLVESSGNLVIADEGKLIATLGVRDLVIVQSGGATLIANKSDLDGLKTLVEGLSESEFRDAL